MGTLSATYLLSTTDTIFVKSANYSMNLHCLFNQSLYTNGKECCIKDLNGYISTSQLIMESADLTTTIESGTYSKTILGDKNMYTLVMGMVQVVEIFGFYHNQLIN